MTALVEIVLLLPLRLREIPVREAVLLDLGRGVHVGGRRALDVDIAFGVVTALVMLGRGVVLDDGAKGVGRVVRDRLVLRRRIVVVPLRRCVGASRRAAVRRGLSPVAVLLGGHPQVLLGGCVVVVLPVVVWHGGHVAVAVIPTTCWVLCVGLSVVTVGVILAHPRPFFGNLAGIAKTDNLCVLSWLDFWGGRTDKMEDY